MNTTFRFNRNKVALNSTFMRLSTGEVGIEQVIARRNAEREARKAQLQARDPKRNISDFSDPFGVNLCR